MAFGDTGLLFIIAHDNGAGLRALAPQTAHCEVTYSGPQAIDFTALNALSISGGSGGATPITLQNVFSVTPLGGNDARIAFDRDALAAVTEPQRSNIISAFVNGGTLSIAFGTDGPDEQLTVQLRALRTGDFVLGASADPHRAHVAHHPGVVGNNVLAPAELTATLAATGYNVSGITLTAEGHLVLPAAAAPPPPGSSGTQTLTLSHAPSGKSATLPVEVHVPTDLIVLLDRSGSMAANIGPGSSKWSVAADVASLFSVVCANMVPDRDVVGGSAAKLLGHHRTSIGRFHWAGGSEVVVIDPFVPASEAPSVPADAPGGSTPIGMALQDAASAFAPASKWRRRHVVVLTDGMDNVGSPRLQDLTAAELPALIDSAETGVVLHNISYVRTGDAPSAALEALCVSHDGQFDSTETDPADALAPEALRAAFLSVLPNIVPAELGGPVAVGATLPVEEGVDRLMLVVNQEGLSLGAQRDGALVAGTTSDSGHGYSWVIVDAPEAGDYGVTGAAAGELYAFFDLTLRTRFGAEARGPGQPVRVFAEVRHHGSPVSGADVRVTVNHPDESLGERLTLAARQGLLAIALRRKLIDPKQLKTAMDQASGQASSHVDVPSVRRQLLQATEALTGQDFARGQRELSLSEVQPGRYEASVEDTDHEEVYTLRFHASGNTPAGRSFARDRRLSVVLAPVPDAARSDTIIRNVAADNQTPLWAATVLPRSASGKPLGPGLVPQLAFHYLDKEDRHKLPKLATVDNLDGTYTTLLATDPNKLPKFGLFWGNPDAGQAVVVRPECPRVRRVSVRLDRIQILDDKDPLLKGKGEIVFETQVAPNASPTRTVAMRLPSSGHYSVGSGGIVEVGQVIFSGWVEEDARLWIGVSGRELDFPSCFDKDDPFTRYVRSLRLPERTTELGPGDEPNDPEALADWKLWYTVGVS